MISNQILQNTIEGLKEFPELTFAFWIQKERRLLRHLRIHGIMKARCCLL